MTMCTDDAHGGRRSKRDAHRRRRARAWRQGLRIRASEPFPHGPAGAARAAPAPASSRMESQRIAADGRRAAARISGRRRAASANAP